MLKGFKVPWVYQRYGQIAHGLYYAKYDGDARLTRALRHSDFLREWGRWQEKDWNLRGSEAPVVMPPNTCTVSTQTEIGESEMGVLDRKTEYLGEVLDFYCRHSGTAFQDELSIAFNNADGYCAQCSHCQAALIKKKHANYHKWKKPYCRCGHPFADKRYYPTNLN